MIELNNNIKLVIWDMDNTFWRGIVSEGEVYPIQDNVDIVHTLIDRGIMNSICSKNNNDMVISLLKKMSVYDEFVFSRINWDPKGPQIKSIIQNCKLRDENVLFIDDEISNLREAQHYCPSINIATPDFLRKDTVLNNTFLKGKPDPLHKRLQQFKILETKDKILNESDSNDEFLKKSNIKVFLEFDCESEFDRIFELIHRSNQLNFTKKRISKEELHEIINNPLYQCGYVKVKDAFGDYGVVGFWAESRLGLEHFLFSCRVLGMGVEQWVYAKLGYPELKITGEVAVSIKKDGIPSYINMDDNGKINRINIEGYRILLRGGCDLSQMLPYIECDSIKTEFNHLTFHKDHTVIERGIIEYSDADKEYLVNNVPFLDKDTFVSEMYSLNFDIVILSLLMDYSQDMYVIKGKPWIKTAYGDYKYSIRESDFYINGSEDEKKFLDEDIMSVGRIGPNDLYDNLCFIRSHIPDRVSLILINGCEIESPDEREKATHRHIDHIELNQIVDQFVDCHKNNTFLLDVRKIITNPGDLAEHIRHYKRSVYFKMAVELSKIINSISKAV